MSGGSHRAAAGSAAPARALTLIELMVVIVLLGLLAGLVSVRLDSATDAAQLRAATLTLENALREARQLAAARHAPALLRIERAPPRVRVECGARAGGWTPLAPCRIAAYARLGDSPSSDATFTARVLTSGFCAPWAIELQRGRRTRVVWTQAVAPEVLAREDATVARLALELAGSGEPPR